MHSSFPVLLLKVLVIDCLFISLYSVDSELRATDKRSKSCDEEVRRGWSDVIKTYGRGGILSCKQVTGLWAAMRFIGIAGIWLKFSIDDGILDNINSERASDGYQMQ